MYWIDIIREDLNITSSASRYALDVLSTLRSQGQTSVTVQQLTTMLSKHSVVAGITLDDKFVTSIIKDSPLVKEIKPNNDMVGKPLTIFLNVSGASGVKPDKQVDKEKKKIHSAAVKQLNKKKK